MSGLKPCFSVGIREAGCDEAGRGCLAGPVMAAAVILPEGWNHPFLNDSKRLTATRREMVRESIESDAIHWAVGTVSPVEIDDINILQASFLAMHRALDQLQLSPECLLIDGNRFRNYKNLPHHCIVKGDGIYRSIAAASILAKTHRDQYMTMLHSAFTEYNWAQNKGYPTAEHRAAIARYGPCDHHRKSFALLPALLLEI